MHWNLVDITEDRRFLLDLKCTHLILIMNKFQFYKYLFKNKYNFPKI